MRPPCPLQQAVARRAASVPTPPSCSGAELLTGGSRLRPQAAGGRGLSGRALSSPTDRDACHGLRRSCEGGSSCLPWAWPPVGHCPPPPPPAPAGVVGARRCCARGAHRDAPGPLLLWVLGDHLVGLLSVSLVRASWLLAGPWTSQPACHADPSDWVGWEPSPADSRPVGPGPSTPALGPQPCHTPRPCFLPGMATCRAWRLGPRHRLKGTLVCTHPPTHQ